MKKKRERFSGREGERFSARFVNKREITEYSLIYGA